MQQEKLLKDYIPLLHAAVDGNRVEVNYLGKWEPINLEGLIRRICHDTSHREFRIIPKVPVTREQAKAALEIIRDKHYDVNAMLLLEKFIYGEKI
jgi:hypothetical protein